MVIIPGFKLGYQGIPKIATSSMVKWLYQNALNAGLLKEYENRKSRKIRQIVLQGQGKGNFSVMTTNSLTEMEPEWLKFYRFALTRDPVKRFISMYTNRVVSRRKLSSHAECSENLKENNLEFSPQINYFISNFEKYVECSDDIKHHSTSMVDLLGPDLSVYDKFYDISESNILIQDILEFWRNNGLKEIADKAPLLPTRPPGGRRIGLEVLTEESFEKLLSYYHHDYENIPTVDIEKIRNEYREIHEKREAIEPIRFGIKDKNLREKKKLKREAKENLK